jgi:hypothetical protein
VGSLTFSPEFIPGIASSRVPETRPASAGPADPAD